MPLDVLLSHFTLRHQHTLSRLGVAGVHSPEGATGRHRPVWAVPLGHKYQVGGGERKVGSSFCLQGVEEPPGPGVSVQESQDFTVNQFPAAVAACWGQDSLTGS